jgi:hypothetical protein
MIELAYKQDRKHYVNAADRDDPAFGVNFPLTAYCLRPFRMPAAADRDDPAVGPTPSKPPTRLHLKDKPGGSNQSNFFALAV